MISREIKSLGIEFEGSFKNKETLQVIKNTFNYPERFEIKSDGSVHVYHDTNKISNGEVTFYSTSKREIIDFLDKMFRIGNAKTNSSCGLHVHVLFNDMDKWIKLLSNRGFQTAFFKEYLKEFGLISKYKFRLTSRWCKRRYDENNIINGINRTNFGTRYKAINFQALIRHGTIEFRLFPYQEDFVEAQNTINWFVNTLTKLAHKNMTLVPKKQIDYFSSRINSDRYIDLNNDIIEKETTINQNQNLINNYEVSICAV